MKLFSLLAAAAVVAIASAASADDQVGGDRQPGRPQTGMKKNECNTCHDSSVSFGRRLTPDPDPAMELLDERIFRDKPVIADGNRRRKTIALDEGVALDLVWIPAGKFVMGSNNGNPSERPAHVVAISKGFWMGKTEVTQAQYRQVMGAEPSEYKDFRDDLPVESVTWDDAVTFCAALQKIVGDAGTVRLPTEAEWEYACRAGTTRHYNVEPADDAAWFARNTAEVHGPKWTPPLTQPVAQKKPNAWGLYDMHGNVWEWCSDWYGQDYYQTSPSADPQGPAEGELRVRRGGSWCSFAQACRSAQRPDCPQLPLRSKIGFRVVVASEGRGEPPAPEAGRSGAATGIIETLRKDGRFSTLTKALTEADLIGTLEADGKFTLFAPTDQAFALFDEALAGVGEGSVKALLTADNKQKLRAIVTSHVVSEETSLADALQSKEVATLQGGKLRVVVSRGSVRVNQATVVDGNLPCSNGLIHVIDRVITPRE